MVEFTSYKPMEKSIEQSPVIYLVGGLEHFFVAYILHFGPNVKYYSPFLLVIFSIRWFGNIPQCEIKPYKVVPSSFKLVYNPLNYRYITNKNHRKIGVICTNLAI